MRIAQIANLYSPQSGGIKRFINELSQQYGNLGHHVTVILPAKTDTFQIRENVSIIQLKSPPLPFSGGYRIITRIKSVIELLKDFEPDVVEISDRLTLLLVAKWCRKKSIMTVFFAHERLDGVLATFAPWLPFKALILNYWNKRTVRQFSHIVATTRYASEEILPILTAGRQTGSDFHIVPLGVDHEKFSPSSQNSPKTYMLACTRLSSEKDPLLLLEIARELKMRGVNQRLYIAGSGPLLCRMQEMVAAEKLNVQFLNYISNQHELINLMRGATIFLAVGPIETFGLAALEALACGTPVLCRDTGAIGEIINQESGLALPRDSCLWANLIEDIYSNHLRFDKLEIKKRAEEFSWRRSAESLLKIYQRVPVS